MTDRPDILYLFRGAGHGGDAIATLRLAATMRDRGLSVRCAASPFEDHFNAFATRAAALELPCDSVAYYDAAGGSRARFAVSLARYVRSLHPRVIHLSTGNGFVNPSLAITLATAHRGRRVVTLHGLRARETTEAKHIRDQNISERFFHAVITPTQYARSSYLACSARPRSDRVRAVGNLVGPAVSKSRCAIRQELGIPCDVPLVLFAARLVESKGPLVAIRAFAGVAKRHPRSLLLVAGDGPELGACRDASRMLGDRVRFLGFRDGISDLMSAADIFLAASRFESFGLTTLEAMAGGAAVVAFDIPATRELLGDGGRLTQSHDQASLSRDLDWLLSNPDQRARLAGIARERYAASYSADAIVRRHLEIYGMPR